jgi:hypothetical protein
MPFFYYSGEEIEAGDRVTYHDADGEIEFVAEHLTGDPGIDWYITELGGGVMIREPKFFGSVFITDTANDVDLIFVARNSPA